jgi:hypothetical protein
MMEMRINPDYHELRVRELELTADYLMKVQVEKEEAREERERLREERKAEQELAAERAQLDKEREHYLNALEALKASGDNTAIADLEERLHEIDDAIERNDYRTANIRAGYVYVISNRGSLGPNMVKIGLTRRLEPMDRVRELGDASVPFPFDVHAMFFADDAVTVEADLHRAFADRRVNVINQRHEFFFATPSEVREVLLEQVGNLLEFADDPEATQYLHRQEVLAHRTVLERPLASPERLLVCARRARTRTLATGVCSRAEEWWFLDGGLLLMVLGDHHAAASRPIQISLHAWAARTCLRNRVRQPQADGDGGRRAAAGRRGGRAGGQSRRLAGVGRSEAGRWRAEDDER